MQVDVGEDHESATVVVPIHGEALPAKPLNKIQRSAGPVALLFGRGRGQGSGLVCGAG
jgi:hypothetical protein